MDFQDLDLFEAIPIINNDHFDKSNSYSFEYELLLSPPISISDNSAKEKDKYRYSELSSNYENCNKNESDVRELNFLKRMKNNNNGSNTISTSTDINTDIDMNKNDFIIEHKYVPNYSLLNTKSSLKTKLASLSTIDRSILKRSANRKASRQEQNRVPSNGDDFNFIFENDIKNDNDLEQYEFIIKDIW